MPNLTAGHVVTAAEYNAVCPVGVVLPFAGSTVPTDWLACDGSAVSRTTYADLYAAIGTTYGTGDGSTTFNLPDLRGRVAVGKGTHTDVSSLGNNDGVTAANRRPKHRHTPHSHVSSEERWTQLTGGTGTGLARANGQGNTSQGTGTITATADGGSGNSNDPLDAPAYIVLNYIIKT